jgi:5'-3' exonuclease
MNNRIAAADGNWMIHRIFHTQSQNSKDVGAAIAYRLLALICKDALAVKAKKVIVAFDGPNVFRHKLMDAYKANRHKEEEDVELLHNKDGLVADDGPYKYLAEACAYLAAAGIPVVQYDQYEADDVLASVAFNNELVSLLCKDKDAYQTLRPGVSQYDGSYQLKGVPKPRTITHKDVEAIFGVPSSQCVDLQTLTGDGIDNIPKLVSRAKAIKGLQEHGTLKAWLAKDTELAAKLKPVKNQLNLNRKLVRLVTNIQVEVPAIRWSNDQKLPRSYFEFKDFCNPKSKGLF